MMDHFEQVLKGNIKSMIASHAFNNYQEMYQRVVKTAQVLYETERENKTTGQEKRKLEYDKGGRGNINCKRFNVERPHDKGKQHAQWQKKTTCYCRN